MHIKYARSQDDLSCYIANIIRHRSGSGHRRLCEQRMAKFICQAMGRCDEPTHFHTSSTFWPLVPRKVTPSAANSCGLVTGLNVLKVDAPGNRHLRGADKCGQHWRFCMGHCITSIHATEGVKDPPVAKSSPCHHHWLTTGATIILDAIPHGPWPRWLCFLIDADTVCRAVVLTCAAAAAGAQPTQGRPRPA
jgi:hypothetical protein